MKVHYKLTVIAQIRREILKAAESDREIERIELTDAEMMRFKKELSSIGGFRSFHSFHFKPEIQFEGVTICKEAAYDLEDF